MGALRILTDRLRRSAGRVPTCLLLLLLCSPGPHAQSVQAVEQSPDAIIASARTQYLQGDFATARESYARAIADIERREGHASLQLVEPLSGYAGTLTAMQQRAAAVASLHRATGIVRRGAGVYDPQQYPLLMRLVDLYSLDGDLDEAHANLRYLQRISEVSHGRHSAAHARSMLDIADWECRIGRFEEARRQYRQIIAVLERQAPDRDLIDALLGLGRCCLDELSAEGIETTAESPDRYRGPVARSGRMNPDSPAFHFHVSAMLRVDGEQALRRAVELTQMSQSDPVQRRSALLLAGDWFQIKDHRRTALRYYTQAQVLPVPSEAGPDQPLMMPSRILYAVPVHALPVRGVDSTSGTQRVVEIEFTVLTDGKSDRERIISRGAGKSAVDETLSSLRAARFRPRIVDGRAVEAPNVVLRQAFPDF